MPGVLTDISDERLQQAERQLRRQVARATFNQISDIEDPRSVVVRDILPAQDLDTTGTNGWGTGDAAWFQDLSGGTTDGWNDVYQLDHSAQLENKVLGLLQLINDTPATTLSQWRIQRNTDGSGGNIDVFQAEALNTDEEAEGTIVDPDMHVYGPSRDALIQAYSVGAPQDGEQWIFEGVVGEDAGVTVQQPPTPILGQDGEPNSESLATDGGWPTWYEEIDGRVVRCDMPLYARQVA